MPEIGQLSGSLEKKEYGYKPRSRVYAGPEWGWQTEESYQKIVQDRNRGLGSEAVDFIEEKAGQVFGLISQIPGVKEGLQFVGGAAKFVDETAIQPAIRAAEDPSQTGTPQALIGTVLKTGQLAEQGGAQVARNLGVDPRIGSFVAGTAYETVTGAVVGKAGKVYDTLTPPGGTPQFATAGVGGPQLTMRGGGVNLNPQAMPITVDPKFRAPGMVQDVSQQPEFRGALDRRRAALEDVQQNIARREAQGKSTTKYKKELAGKGSTLDYDPNDPIVFEKNRYKVYDPLDPERTAHQHHLFAKAQSYPFVEKMEELIAKGVADEDDLVNMFAWADMLDVTMGNTRKNMLDAPGRSHISAAPGSTQFDKSRNIHTLLKDFDLEISGKQVRKLIENASNATELMDLFNDYIVQSVKPQKAVAQRIVEDFLARHRAQLPKDQLELFEDLASKLGGRYKQ